MDAYSRLNCPRTRLRRQCAISASAPTGPRRINTAIIVALVAVNLIGAKFVVNAHVGRSGTVFEVGLSAGSGS